MKCTASTLILLSVVTLMVMSPTSTASKVDSEKAPSKSGVASSSTATYGTLTEEQSRRLEQAIDSLPMSKHLRRTLIESKRDKGSSKLGTKINTESIKLYDAVGASRRLPTKESPPGASLTTVTQWFQACEPQWENLDRLYEAPYPAKANCTLLKGSIPEIDHISVVCNLEIPATMEDMDELKNHLFTYVTNAAGTAVSKPNSASNAIHASLRYDNGKSMYLRTVQEANSQSKKVQPGFVDPENGHWQVLFLFKKTSAGMGGMLTVNMWPHGASAP